MREMGRKGDKRRIQTMTAGERLGDRAQGRGGQCQGGEEEGEGEPEGEVKSWTKPNWR